MLEGLTQKQAGERMGVDANTVLNWEKCKTIPLPKDWPNIASFLESDDVFPLATTIAEKLRVARLRKGWSRKVAAKELGVDESTLRDWEGGKVVLLAKHRQLVADFLGMLFAEVDEVMRVAWNEKHG